jgi:hypothetical protein
MGRKRRKTWEEVVANSPFLSALERWERHRLAASRPIDETLAPLVERAARRWVEYCSAPFANDEDAYLGCLGDMIRTIAGVSDRDVLETGLSEDRLDEA